MFANVEFDPLVRSVGFKGILPLGVPAYRCVYGFIHSTEGLTSFELKERNRHRDKDLLAIENDTLLQMDNTLQLKRVSFTRRLGSQLFVWQAALPHSDYCI
jgi:hypothetical protein